ncbi:MAG: PD40 domain-containing protein [Deltaproteobacteria bacterium]|nr:PD40 domain-containing protein [Deltaproteobacteria bacterium]
MMRPTYALSLLLFITLACSSPAAKTASQPADTKADSAVVDTAVAVDAAPDATPAADVPTSKADSTAAPDEGQGLPAGVTLAVDTTDTSTPEAAAAVVGTFGTLDPGLEVLYPPNDAMVPVDFAPITVQWTWSGAAPTVFVVRLETEEAQFDVVGDPQTWAKGPGYVVTLPKWIWAKLFLFPDHPDWTLRVLAATVQGGKATNVATSKPQTLHTSAMPAGGAIYYWNTQLQGVRVLEQGQAPTTVSTGAGMCAGCHSVSPDGSTVAVSHMMGAGMTSMSMTLVNAKTGASPSWLHPKAAATLASSFTIAAAFSPAYFSDQVKWLVVPSSNSASIIPTAPKLLAVDLMGGKSKALVKGGDLGQQAFPTWSPDGKTVVYASAKDVGNGFSASQPTKLYAVPFNGGEGDLAAPISGADDDNVFQYYPTFSIDGQYIAFNRVDLNAAACPASAGGGPSSGGGTYDNCNAELWIIPAAGGAPIRLDLANQSTDPLTNSWPTFGNVPGNLYWMAFSSKRSYGFLHTGSPPTPQIYVAAIDPKKLAAGQDGSYAALWLPGQDMTSGNHIARWSSPPRE